MKLHLPLCLKKWIQLSIVLSCTLNAEESISISFGSTTMNGVTEDKSELGGVEKDGWNIVPAANAEGTTVFDNNGNDAGSLILTGVFGGWSSSVSDVSTVTGVVQRNYLDVKNYGNGSVHYITLNHDYWIYEAHFYMSGDQSGYYAPMVVNGETYIGGTNHVLHDNENPAWGIRGGTTKFTDDNTIIVTNQYGTLQANNVYIDPDTRATLAGIQIVNRSNESGIFTTLSAGSTETTAAEWIKNGENVVYGNIADGDRFLGINAADEGSTLIVSPNDKIVSLAAVTNVTTLSSEGTFTINQLYTYEGAKLIIDAACETHSLAGKGSFEISENGKLIFKESSAENAILSATGTGTIEVHFDTTVHGVDLFTDPYQQPTTSTFQGNVSVKNGTLIIGDNGRWNGYWGVNLSSLKSIDLDGGHLKLFGSNSDLSVINVNKKATMNLWEASVLDGKGFSIEKVVLNADLSSHAEWGSTLHIDKITGHGDLSFTKGDWQYIISIDDLESGGIAKNEANLTLGANSDSTIKLSSTLYNTGVVTTNATITIASDFAKYKMLDTGEILGYSNGGDGYLITKGSTYAIIDNEGGTVNLYSTKAYLNGELVDLTYNTETGDVSFVATDIIAYDGIYRMNTQDITVGGASATANTDRALAFEIAQGRTLTIAGDNGVKAAGDIMLNSTGKGNIILMADASLSSGEMSHCEGNLTVKNAKISLISDEGDGASISSFSTVTLDGSTLYYCNRMDNYTGIVQNLIVTQEGARLEVEDMGALRTSAFNLSGTTTLNGDFTVSNYWNTEVSIETLTGKGNLIIDSVNRKEYLSLLLNGQNQFSGEIIATNNTNDLHIKTASNANFTVRYQNSTGEIDLMRIASGNVVVFDGASGHFYDDENSGVFVLEGNQENNNIALELTGNETYNKAYISASISGTGDLVINYEKNKATDFKFSGDLSEWGGNLTILKGSHDITFDSSAREINASSITTSSIGTVNLKIATASDTIVNSNIIKTEGTGDGKLNLSVENTKNTQFNGAIRVDSLTAAAKSKVSFDNQSINIRQLTLGDGASINFNKLETLILEDLTLGSNSNLSAKTTTIKGNIQLSAGSHINGDLNLTMARNLNFDTTDAMLVSIDGALILSQVPHLTLSGTLYDAIINLEKGAILELLYADDLRIEGAATYSLATATSTQIKLENVFSNYRDDSLYLCHNNGVVYVTRAVPEPTTATLSLLALAALAACRRRK